MVQKSITYKVDDKVQAKSLYYSIRVLADRHAGEKEGCIGTYQEGAVSARPYNLKSI
jgi:hypothetical protein